uniref:Cyclin-dependent protein kinase inhibitor SMR9-like n=1 Tax=Nelumbo nucifera TaxID=4432 RepID=A0A822ZFY2_NELNU|nr:TPA_asm: hypothetical protein HUJ06_000589 [Nelumbo nucifera]
MAPSDKRTRRRRRRKTQHRRCHLQLKSPELTLESSCSSTTTSSDEPMKIIDSNDDNGVDISAGSGCSTPKAQRFRIPEVLSCPPAPKKRRVASHCSSRRSPISFFSPPDIELFFLFAFRDISV